MIHPQPFSERSADNADCSREGQATGRLPECRHNRCHRWQFRPVPQHEDLGARCDTTIMKFGTRLKAHSENGAAKLHGYKSCGNKTHCYSDKGGALARGVPCGAVSPALPATDPWGAFVAGAQMVCAPRPSSSRLQGCPLARPVQVAGDTLALPLAEGWVAGKHLQSTERDYSITIVLFSCSVVEL